MLLDEALEQRVEHLHAADLDGVTRDQRLPRRRVRGVGGVAGDPADVEEQLPWSAIFGSWTSEAARPVSMASHHRATMRCEVCECELFAVIRSSTSDLWQIWAGIRVPTPSPTWS